MKINPRLFRLILTIKNKFIFLLKELSEIGIIEPLLKEGKILNINFRFKINENKDGLLKFRDSYLLLPNSLRELTQSFNVEDKSIFPYNFVNDSNVDLNYVGNVPDLKYFSNITIDQYNEYVNKFKYKKFN